MKTLDEITTDLDNLELEGPVSPVELRSIIDELIDTTIVLKLSEVVKNELLDIIDILSSGNITNSDIEDCINRLQILNNEYKVEYPTDDD